MRFRPIPFIVGIGAAGLILYGLQTCEARAQQQLRGKATAIDGDTVVVGQTHVRLWGIDAPELKQECGEYPAGKVAKAYLQHVIDDKPITCISKGKDQYGRFIGLCKNFDAYDIGRAMVVGGHAWAYLRYSADYAEDELKARFDKVGLWKHQCVDPERWRRANGSGDPPVPSRQGRGR